jgi:hypothetical protein
MKKALVLIAVAAWLAAGALALRPHPRAGLLSGDERQSVRDALDDGSLGQVSQDLQGQFQKMHLTGAAAAPPSAGACQTPAPGDQSYLTPGQVRQMDEDMARMQFAARRDGLDDVRRIVGWLGNRFSHETDGGASIGKMTAQRLVEEDNLAGCTDFALLMSAALRYGCYEARMVDTVDAAWMRTVRAQGTPCRGAFQGHAFVEADIKGRWVLINSAEPHLQYMDWKPGTPEVSMSVKSDQPEHYCVMLTGYSPGDYGIKSVCELNKLMFDFAMTHNPDDCSASTPLAYTPLSCAGDAPLCSGP